MLPGVTLPASLAALLGAPVLAALRIFGPLRKTPAVFALRWIWAILPSIAFWILLRRWMLDAGVPDGAAVVMATHSAEAAAIAQTRIQLRDGRIATVERA